MEKQRRMLGVQHSPEIQTGLMHASGNDETVQPFFQRSVFETLLQRTFHSNVLHQGFHIVAVKMKSD